MRTILRLATIGMIGVVLSQPANSNNLPGGSYLGSCNTCSYDGTNLCCDNCSNGNHNFISNVDSQKSCISINKCGSGRASNQNGNLTCE